MINLIRIAISMTLLLISISCGSSKDSNSHSSSQTTPKTSSLEITQSPAINLANQSNYELRGTCSREGSDIAVTVNTEDPIKTTCSNLKWQVNVNLSSLSDNANITIVVKESGQRQSARVQVAKDTVLPTANLGSYVPKAINSGNQTTYRLEGSCDENGKVHVKIGTLDVITVDCTNNTNWSLNHNVSNLTGTAIAIIISMVDTVGNESSQVTQNVNRDVVAPNVTLANTNPHINASNTTNYSLNGSCETGLDVSVTVGDLTKQTLSCNTSAWSLTNYDTTALAVGTSYSLIISQIDAAENEGRVEQTLIKDITAPTITLSSSLLVNSQNQSDFTLSGSCSEEGQDVTITIAPAQPVTTPCASTNWTYQANLSDANNYPDGNINVTLAHTDRAGNETSLSDQTTRLSKDTTVPTISFTTTPSINGYNEKNYTIEGRCSGESTKQVTIAVAGLTDNQLRDCADPWKATIDVSSLVDSNSISLTASITDSHDNTATAQINLVKDKTAPVVTINTLSTISQSTDRTIYPLSGTCDGNGIAVSVSGENQTPTNSPTCQNNTWSTTIDISSLTGNISFAAYQKDTAGNIGSAPPQSLVTEDYRITVAQKKIALSTLNSCTTTNTGGVKCWGSGSYGMMGNGTLTGSGYPGDVLVAQSGANLNGIISLSAGSFHICSLTQTGGVKCWGRNNKGQLGNGTTTNSSVPVDVLVQAGGAALSNIVSISSAQNHMCSLTQTGGVKCWGSNDNGQLGNGTTTNSSVPVDVLVQAGGAALSGIVSISSGNSHNCALNKERWVYCWGSGNKGQLGHTDGTYYNEQTQKYLGFNFTTPVQVRIESGGEISPLNNIIQISAGQTTTCALTQTGRVKCWGNNTVGELGNNQTANSFFPVDVVTSASDNSPLGSTVPIIALSNKNCALTQQNQVKCWGSGSSGLLGNNTTTSIQRTPVSVLAGQGTSTALANVIELGQDSIHRCVLLNDGGINCWGLAYVSQLGNGSGDSKNYPTTVKKAADSDDFFQTSTYQKTYSCLNNSCSLNPIILSFANSTSSPSSNNLSPEIEVSGLTAGETLALYSDSACQTTSLGSATPSSTTINLSGVGEGVHRYHYTITANSNTSGCSPHSLSYILDQTVPSTPIISFPVSTGTDVTPDLSVSGIIPGNLVKIYNNSSCTTKAGPTTRVDGISKSISVTAITGSVGNYPYYASTIDRAGNESLCSAAASYTLSSGL